MAGKFSKEAEKQVIAMQTLVNRSIRSAMLAGLLTATKETKHDSSNAATHWMIAAANGSKSKPWQRRLGQIRDLRGSHSVIGEAAVAPTAPVGYQNDGGSNKAGAMRFVRERELKEVLDKLVVGLKSEAVFYFYNAVGGDPLYGSVKRAGIDNAGQKAVDRAMVIAARALMAGKTRRSR